MPKYSTHIRWQLREIHVALILLLALFFTGTFGYMELEHWSVLDSAYMAVITLSTVGFSEVHNLSQPGKVFTACLILSGVGLAAYALATLSRDIVEGSFWRIGIFRRMQKRILGLQGHTIVCGYGRLARLVMQELKQSAAEIVIVENDPQVAQELIEAGYLFIEGTAHDDETLKAAGVDRASTLLSLVSSEADNVYITLVARDLNPKLHIIARSESEAAEAKLKRAGANQILAPYRLSASRIAQQLLRPNVSNFIEVATSADGRQLLLEEVCVPAGSPLSGMTLADTALRHKTGAMVAGSIDVAGRLTINPSAQSRLEAGQTLIVLGDKEAIDKITDLVSRGGA